MNAVSSNEKLPSFLRMPRATLLCIAIPYGLAAILCLLMHPEVGSLLAPLLGPWAGNVYGHHDCTMANQIPVPSAIVAGLLAAALATSRFLRSSTSRPARVASHAFLAFAATSWFLFALVSTVNTLE